MNKEEVLKKYKNLKNKNTYMVLNDDRNVIATEADENNKLYYVIEKKGKLSLERAKGQAVEKLLWHKERTKVLIPNNNG